MTRWLRGAQDELKDLILVADQNPAEAWRAATLIIRLLNGPVESAPSDDLIQRLPRLITRAGPPDAKRVLDDVADRLDSTDDPWGPLADALLDADDAISVMALADTDLATTALADQVAALISLWPERVLDLGEFAQMRLRSMRDGVAASSVWRAVTNAPALVLVDALPLTPSALQTPSSLQLPARSPWPSQRAAKVDQRRWYEFPSSLHRAAADSVDERSFSLEVEGQSTNAWVYSEDGQMRLELASVSQGATAELVVHVDGEALHTHTLPLEVDGSTGYADLGEWAGSTNLLHRLVALVGASPAQVRFVLWVSSE